MTAQPETLTDLKLPDEMKQLVNNAFDDGFYVVVAYVDHDGQPSLSFRGSTQAYSDNQLAIWVRNPDGGGLKAALEKNPRLTLMYRNPQTRANFQFRGRGHIENSEEVRRKVYDNSPKGEKDRDPEQKGMPLIIDLDRVDGMMPPVRIAMRR
jgi:hypothetical protein